MENLNRRSALALGLTVAAIAPLVAAPRRAAAEMYGPNEGKEFHPGVRVVMLGKSESTIPAYKTIQLSDTVFQPGSTWPDEAMPNDMVCTVIEGELELVVDGETHRHAIGGPRILADEIAKPVRQPSGLHRRIDRQRAVERKLRRNRRLRRGRLRHWGGNE